MMKAIQLFDEKKVIIVDKETPVLKSGEVLLKIEYVGFCGSDLNTYLGKNPMVVTPVIPGHEIGAVICSLSDDVPNGFAVGMTCTVNPYTSCGNCASCRNGHPNACQFNQTLGVQRDGAMCEYLAVHWSKIIADNTLTTKNLALVEPLSVGFHAVSRGAVTDLDVVMVLGCGMIGLGGVIRAALRGARVVAVDMDDDKLILAKKLGAAYTINAKTENMHERLMEITKGSGPDVVIEAVGSPATYQLAVNEVAFTGRVVCIGYAKQDISFETKKFVMKEMDILGSRNAMPEDFRAVMEYLKRGECQLDELVSSVCEPFQVQESLENWALNPQKVFRILVKF